jgi:hypothetical protein
VTVPPPQIECVLFNPSAISGCVNHSLRRKAHNTRLLSRAKFLHHLSKLLEGDLAVTVGIDLFHDFVDGLLTELLSEAQYFLDLGG